MTKRRYGLIGYPLGHSFSKSYFSKKFIESKINATYDLYELEDIENIREFIMEKELQGINITIPHKEAILPHLDELSVEAKAIGAVNTVKVEEGGLLMGYNTDCLGFADSLRPLLREDIEQAFVLGTGGSSKAVCYALQKMDIDPILISRSHGKGAYTYASLPFELAQKTLLWVNTTPLGMHPKIGAAPEMPYQAIGARHLVYDLVYNPEQTLFLKHARQQGASIKNGLEMLYLQAEAAWEMWNRG